MRKNAFDEGSERDRYTGEPSGKTPELKTPPAALKTLEKALESNLTPPPIGMQTVVCLFQKRLFFYVACLAMVNFHLGWFPKNNVFPAFYERVWDLWGPFFGDQPKWKICS